MNDCTPMRKHGDRSLAFGHLIPRGYLDIAAVHKSNGPRRAGADSHGRDYFAFVVWVEPSKEITAGLSSMTVSMWTGRCQSLCRLRSESCA